MAEFYAGGQLIFDKNAIHENLLNNSVGPFVLKGNLSKLNWEIFDLSTANLVKGKSYCLSLNSTGTLVSQFDSKSNINNFQVWLYQVSNPSTYYLVQGPQSPQKLNSIVFNHGGENGLWKLCIQFFGAYDTILGKTPPISQVKIEEGTNATAWIPSSQDLADLMSKK
ncbi:hypothetical protein [Lactobacillus helveticus]|uniref:hypothetical protein n=1 Tax=Lactobacillus helveticus TaxID=1587 RepID=UPI001562840C|nr:hypothetical protein [Lactobacillus helveticus]NRN88437.1 hypothetical protein [Lactobacillus helveticus]